jgi:NRPS condensation-like uncharacterized protein
MDKYIFPILKVLTLIYLVYFYGFFLGFILYISLFKIYIFLVEKIYNLQSVDPFDQLFLYENINSYNNNVAVLIVNKMELKKFKYYFLENTMCMFKRLSQKITIKFNEYFWEIVNKDNSQIIDDQIKVLNGVSNRDEIIKKCEVIQSELMDINNPLWEIYYQEEYLGYDSLIIFKIHHTLSDGMGMMNLLSSMTRTINSKESPNIPKLSLFQKIILYLLAPFNFVRTFPPKLAPDFKNPLENYQFNKKRIPSGTKKFFVTKKYDFKKLEKIYKSISNATFNDLSWTYLLRSLLTFSQNENILTKSILGVMGLNFRFDIKPKDLGNFATGKMLEFNFKTVAGDFKSSLENVSEVLLPARDKTIFFGSSDILRFILKYLVNLDVIRNYGEDTLKNVGLLFTNLIGPRELTCLYNFHTEINEIIPFVPHATLPFTVVCLSFRGNVTYTFCTDKMNEEMVENISKIFEREIDNSLL